MRVNNKDISTHCLRHTYGTRCVEAGMTAEDIALTIHAHPTLGEITMEAAEVLLGNPIHIVTK